MTTRRAILAATAAAWATFMGYHWARRSPVRSDAAEQGRGDESDRAALARLAVGIDVSHAPNPVRAVEGGRSGHPFTWLFATTVKSIGGPVTVEEFGCFAWQDGRWTFANFTGKPFTAADFADWYACPGAVLEAGKEYTDPKNWSGSTALQTNRTKWYFVGINGRGERVKGESIVDKLAEVVVDQAGTTVTQEPD